MCSVVIGQCDPAMDAKLQVTEDWEANRTDLLFVLKAAQAACISVQDNHSMHVVAHEALCSFANCFQNSQPALTFKQRYIACKTKMDKAGIGFKFTKKFLDKEKAKNPNLNDAGATKAAENRFLGTFWLLNSDVDHSVTENLVSHLGKQQLLGERCLGLFHGVCHGRGFQWQLRSHLFGPDIGTRLAMRRWWSLKGRPRRFRR